MFDVGSNPPTRLFHRGDERHPDTNHIIEPGVPAAFGGALQVDPIPRPHFASAPDKREFVIRDTIAASEKVVAETRQSLEKLRTNSAAAAGKLREQELNIAIAEARHAALLATLKAERLEDAGKKTSDEWNEAATQAFQAQQRLAVEEARLKLHTAQAAQHEAQAKTNATEKLIKELEAATKKAAEAETALADLEKQTNEPPTTAYKPRPAESFPDTSTGRRLAFARWVVNPSNPLAARVAMNHMWLRHFGRGLVPTPADFGRNGRPPSHPQLLDWLASEFVSQGWNMKAMHRLIVTSSAYQQASTPDDASAKLDPDNVYLWRMNSRRLEAEAVRDNLLYVSGGLDLAMGGPDIDHKLGLTSKRRSIYLRIAAEKEVEFLKIFDGPSVNECYERRPSVVPQQALALANSELALASARELARRLSSDTNDDSTAFIGLAFRQVLARRPSREELRLCLNFLSRPADQHSPEKATPISHRLNTDLSSAVPAMRARENLLLVLLNHNDFVTVR